MPEQAGASWGRLGASLNLHNAAIVFFCRLCVLFTIYVSGTNCVNHSDVRHEQKG